MYEGSLCVCCMSTEDLEELFVTKSLNDIEENYGKMLNACLNIQLSATDGHDAICDSCVAKLRDCVAFKKQALRTISILTSIDMTQLVSKEDMEILGLKKETNLVLKTDSNIQKDDEKIPFCNNERIVEDDAFKGMKSKRPVGRPRLRPPDRLPYHIGRDELICRECGEEFPCHITLKVHYNNHFGRHACRSCDKRFVTYASLKKHETSHLKGPFKCDACGQEFRNLNTMYSHKRFKHGTTLPFRCGECGAAFSTLQRRLHHLADEHHKSERRYLCKYCPRRFRHAGERAKHISRKHEIKICSCPVCGLKCRRNGLRAHLTRHAPGRKTAKKTERRFVCKLCNKSFTQKNTLMYHIGSHIRRGQYKGDPGYLIVDRRDPKAKNTGLLSEDNAEELYLDESLLSEGLIRDMDSTNNGKDENVENNEVEDIDIVKILTDVGFSDLDI